MHARDFQERIAAAAPWATFNVHRAANTPAIPLSRLLSPETARRLELPAEDAEPAPAIAPGSLPPGWVMGKFGPVKIAPPGMRYPSSRPAGTPDTIIERIDAYSARVNAGGRVT